VPLNGLPVKSHDPETVVQLNRVSNHSLFLTIRLSRVGNIDWGNGHPVHDQNVLAVLAEFRQQSTDTVEQLIGRGHR
jgi:hypothetical protein